jgi:glycosyltransferase involved in cell wall biosynthesis
VRTLRIALIASARFAIREPFAGGLEAHTWALARGLADRGHEVTVFAGAGCDPELGAREFTTARLRISAAARADVSMVAQAWLEEHHAYLQLMLELGQEARASFDVVHNNCLHHLPVALARLVPVPVITTLHTPPTPWLESAIQAGPSPVVFTAVSAHTARAWRHAVRQVRVIHNGVDLTRWPLGPGGGPLVWSGRLVPEKGADLAIQAARIAGMSLELAGPVGDPQYFAARIRPLLGQDVRYHGHLRHGELAALLGSASACLVTPRWDEPYGLVAAESLACGTPVCGFARGALPEILNGQCSVLTAPDDVRKLAQAIPAAASLPRGQARAHAAAHCSQARMIDAYQALYRELAA